MWRIIYSIYKKGKKKEGQEGHSTFKGVFPSKRGQKEIKVEKGVNHFYLFFSKRGTQRDKNQTHHPKKPKKTPKRGKRDKKEINSQKRGKKRDKKEIKKQKKQKKCIIILTKKTGDINDKKH